jgi:LysM repeat protein
MTAKSLLGVNYNTLGGVAEVVPGMLLTVHHPFPEPPKEDPKLWPPLARKFWQVHVVKPGDTLFVIAQSFNLDYNKICELNVQVNCSVYESLIQVGEVLALPAKTGCTPTEGERFCYTLPFTEPTGPSLRNGYYNFQYILDALKESGIPGWGIPGLVGLVNPDLDRESALDNPFLADYADSIYQLNAFQFAKLQHHCVHDPQTGHSSCTSTKCENWRDMLQWGDLPAGRGCMILAGMHVVIPWLSPLVPVPDLTYPRLQKSRKAEFIGTAADPVHPSFGDIQWLDNHSKALLGGGGYIGWTDPWDGHIAGADSDIRMPYLLPRPDGYPRMPLLGSACGDSGKSIVTLSCLEEFACVDKPGPTANSGHHCLKLTCDGCAGCHDPSQPGCAKVFNESLSTLAQETGLSVQYFVDKYNLTNPNFIHVATAVEVPNTVPKVPTPAPPAPTPAPPPPVPTPSHGCTGCLPGTAGDCKNSATICAQSQGGSCPTGFSKC